MDRRVREAERRYSEEPSAKNMVGIIRARQQAGERFVVNLQSPFQIANPCTSATFLNDYAYAPNACAFGAIHDDMRFLHGPATRVMPRSLRYGRTLNPDGDITPAQGLDLAELANRWVKSIHPDADARRPMIDPETVLAEALDMSDNDLLIVGIPDEDEEEEVFDSFFIYRGYVVPESIHQMIRNTYTNITSHYVHHLNQLEQQEEEIETVEAEDGWVTRPRRGQYRQIMNMLKGATDMRLSMYKSMAMLELTTHGPQLPQLDQ